MINRVRMLAKRSWPPPIARVMHSVKVRCYLLFLVTLLAVVGVLINGVRLWPSLPGEIPARGLSLGAFLLVPTQLPRVPKTILTVFGEVAGSIVLLLLYWVLLGSNLLTATLTWMRSQTIQFSSEFLAALEVCFVNGFLAWFVSWVVLRLSLDGQQIWYLALGRSSAPTSTALSLIGPIAVLGCSLSVAFTLYRLRAVGAK